MGEVIVVTSGKGGVGKTTTTANVGTGLAKLDKKVVLMPQVVSTAFSDGKITLSFDQPLRPCAELYEYEVAGADGRFHNAEAHTEGNKVVITSPIDGVPVRVRHAWKDDPKRLNTYGLTGLPVSPFEKEL